MATVIISPYTSFTFHHFPPFFFFPSFFFQYQYLNCYSKKKGEINCCLSPQELRTI